MQNQTTDEQPERNTIQWELMLPQEFREAFAARPVVFLPLGTVEWHGEHNALGLDSLKAHALCVRAAQISGGIVHPPIYGGMGGLDKPATVVMEDELSWDNSLLRPWLEKLCREFHRIGFRAIIMLTGHYGHNQQLVVRETAIRMTTRLQIPVLGIPEYWLAHNAGYHGDHAGIGETSLLWHLRAELVAIERIRTDPEYGATDRIERGSSPELGRKYAEIIAGRLAQLAQSMPDWNAETRAAFVRAERALIDAQVRGWRETGNEWQAWNTMREKGLWNYGSSLAAQDFAAIEALAAEIENAGNEFPR